MFGVHETPGGTPVGVDADSCSVSTTYREHFMEMWCACAELVWGACTQCKGAPVCSKRCFICDVPPPTCRAGERPRTRASAVAPPLFAKGAHLECAPSAHAVVRVRTRTSTPTPSQHASKTRWCVCIRQCLRVQALGSCALPGKGIAMRARAGEGIAKGRQGGILPVPTARSEAALPPRPVKSTCPPVATAPMRPCLPWKAWQHREVPNRRLMQGPPNPITGRIL